MTAVYLAMMIVGALLLAFLAGWHQELLPLERRLTEPEWVDSTDDLAPPDEPIEIANGRVVLRLAEGATLAFAAPGLDVGPGGAALVEAVGGRRLLALLDRGLRKRALLVDPDRAAQGGTLHAGLLGHWRHGTGALLAGAGQRLLACHRGFGRDRIYVLDPQQAAAGRALSLGVKQTFLAPCRGLTRLHVRGRELRVARGDRAWTVELA